MRKKLYENKYVLTGTPDEMPKKLSKVGKILAKVDVESFEVNISTRGYRSRDIISWFTQKRLAVIGVVLSLVSVLLALMFGLAG